MRHTISYKYILCIDYVYMYYVYVVGVVFPYFVFGMAWLANSQPYKIYEYCILYLQIHREHTRWTSSIPLIDKAVKLEFHAPTMHEKKMNTTMINNITIIIIIIIEHIFNLSSLKSQNNRATEQQTENKKIKRNNNNKKTLTDKSY